MKKEKVAKRDFLITDLPTNRKALFFDILKNQWNNLILLAVIILLISIPFILLRYYNLVIVTNIVNNSAENIKDNLFGTYVLYNIINLFVIIISGILCGGISRIYKKLAYNEGFFIGADFIKGIKENFRDFLVIFTVYGVFNFILEILCIQFLLENNYLYYFFKVINYFILLPILFISVSLSSIYSDSIYTKIKTASRLYIKYLFKNLLVFIIVVLPLFILHIGSSYIQLFLPIGYCLIYFPIVYLMFVLYMNYIFDIQINKKNFPHLVGKGMYKN